MDPAATPRSIAKQQYATVRRSLTVFEERVVDRYWDEDALVRVSFERFLDSLDRFAGWLLADDELASDLREQEDVAEQPTVADKTVADKVTVKTDPVDVTFTLPAEVEADSVALCGEFNQWSAEATQLERGSDGTWRATVALEPGRSYRYRYLLDGERWENAWQADRYVPNPYGSVDSLIIVQARPEG